MKALVLGGYGAVGTPLVRYLRDSGVDTVAAGRDPARADRVLDLADLAAVEDAAGGVDVVVNASGAEDVRVARAAVCGGATFVDITATTPYARDLEAVEGPVLLGVGLAPGLTGMLAVAAAGSSSGAVEILVGLGAGEHHGPAAAAWTYSLLGTHFDDPDGGRVRNYTRARAIPVPPEVSAEYRAFPSFRTDFADQHVLTESLGAPVRTYLRLDSRVATLGLAALTWTPVLRGLAPARMWGSDRWIVQARAADGPTLWASGSGQSDATAAVAAWAVRGLADEPIGRPTWLHDRAQLEDARVAMAHLQFGVTERVFR
ncbi:NAD dependent epimerase/dehydratase family [Prescottella defluvii]|uniref:NAD-dependent epimerase/dehydratase family protein n=1 Tax=Prescottella defluvii TaxID=1323361 RepID=UPI0004F2B0CE|nr:NAD-dependent epimerase/dehydratase family protein [Prescottella defluvii]